MTLHLIWFVKIYYHSARRCIVKGLSVFWTRMTVKLLPMSLYTHTLRVLPIHFGRETVPSGRNMGSAVQHPCEVQKLAVFLYKK